MDPVAIVALIISLLALIIALGQLSQQLLGTADGYRRCKAEVIGEWSGKTDRRWLWYEFRFETLYVTPEIDLLTPSQLSEKERRRLVGGGPFLLNSRHPPKEIDRTVHRSKDLRKGSRYDELLVSWIPFLRELHRAYNVFLPNECKCMEPKSKVSLPPTDSSPSSTFPTLSKIQMKSRETPGVDQDGDADPKLKENVERTGVIVSYRTLSWDFMPSDGIRPLASSHFGTLTVLALRLGMRWLDARPGKEGTLAAGNGYNLTSTSMRGLGTVVQFNYDVGTPRQVKIIPSEAADKMMCGILPGDRALGIRDFDIIGNGGKPGLIRLLLEELHVSADAIRDLTDPDLMKRMQWFDRPFRRTGFNDVVCLLCPFMPLEDSKLVELQYLGWVGMQPMTIFCYWEGRKALLLRLKERIERGDVSTDLEYVHKQFTTLESDYYGDFYCRPAMGAVFGGDKEGEANEKRKLGLLDLCRQSFRHTTEYFSELQRNDSDNEKFTSLSLKYIDLVGAHSTMATTASMEAKSRWFQEHGKKKQPYNLQIGDRRGPYLHEESYEIAWAYPDFLPKYIEDVRKRWRRTGGNESATLTDEKIRDAWWMLMLRGVCWAMSVRIVIPPDAVAASLYRNRTPVWIT